MNKVSVTEQVPEALSVPDVPGLSVSGEIVSHKVIDKNDFSLALWRHELEPGAKIRIERPAEDPVFYVVAGEILVGATPVGRGGAFSIAKNAIAEVGGKGTLLHYIGDAVSRPDKAGGCVHILSQPWEEHSPISSHALYFDSSCPTCSVWLHRTRTDAGRFVAPHRHTESEIICVVQGELDLGTRAIATGGAVGVAENVNYSFRSGPEGLAFVNFRQADPFFIPKEKPEKPPASERMLVRNLLTRLAAEKVAAQ